MELKHARLLKDCPLLSSEILFSSCSLNSSFLILEKSYITPIHKSGPKHCVSNYWTISILNHFSKVLDAIVTEKISEFLLCKLIEEQHGFIKTRSTLTNLLVYTDFIANALENGEQVNSIYLDFRKTFDNVCHRRLISKLYNLGIRGVALSWISYLEGRVNYVNIKGTVSSPFSVPSGAPQGFHLGPLLFVAFINDIFLNIVKCNILLYADDAKLYRTIKSVYDITSLQTALDSLAEWSEENGLILNIKKCKKLSCYRGSRHINCDFNINNKVLDSVSSMKDLGVLFNTKLSFDSHIDISSKTLSLLGLIIRNTSLSQIHPL